MEAIVTRVIAIRLEAIAVRVEAITIRVEDITARVEAIAIRVEAIAVRVEAIRVEDITVRFCLEARNSQHFLLELSSGTLQDDFGCLPGSLSLSLRKWVQDDALHIGTPENPQGSKEHKTLRDDSVGLEHWKEHDLAGSGRSIARCQHTKIQHLDNQSRSWKDAALALSSKEEPAELSFEC